MSESAVSRSEAKVLEAKGVRKNFGGVVALAGANLECTKGRITGLLGANGSGKSTMSKIITGVHAADAGTIVYDGRSVAFRNPNEARQNGIAMVFQSLSLVGNLPVWQNIVLGAERLKGRFLDDDHARTVSSSLVDQLQPGLDVEKPIHELHPGEMQIVEIAKALYMEPHLLILDEPTAALEHAQVQKLFAVMRRLAEEGVGIVFTSHRIWEVMDICDDIVVFRNGRDVATLREASELKDPDRIVSYITGQTRAEEVGQRVSVATEETLLKVENLNHGRDIRNVGFTLRKGEILGVGGLAGQGQHELMLALAGNYPDLKGSVELRGKPIELTKPAHAIENDICLVPGDRQLEGLFLEHTVFTNLAFPRIGMKGHPLFTPENRYRREAEEIIKALSVVTHTLDRPVSTLSGGNQQKVVVGKWLPFDIDVLLLADPAKGVDVGAKHDLYEYILRLVREKEMGVILYASDNEELIDYCDRLMIMYEGAIVSMLEGDDINEDKIVSASLQVNREASE